MKEEEKAHLHKVFVIVKEYVWEQGGDGWGYILSRHYKLIADEFQEWENSLPNESPEWGKTKWFTDRQDTDDATIFGNGQEAIIFMDEDARPEYSDITVVLPEL